MTDGTPEAVKFKPAAEMIISELEALKVLADPLRLSLMELLTKPSTVKRVANKIGKPPTKLYYHINLLEKHGLIEMVDTRIVSGIVEKHYQTSARSFRVSHDLLTPGSEGWDENMDVMLSGIFGDTRNDLLDSVNSGTVILGDDAPTHQQLRISRGRMWLSPDKADEFYEKLTALMKEYQGWDEENERPQDEGAHPYSLMFLLHPSSRKGLGGFEENGAEDDIDADE